MTFSLTFAPTAPTIRLQTTHRRLLALLTATAITCTILFHPFRGENVETVGNAANAKDVEFAEHVGKAGNVKNVTQPALPGFSVPFTCNPTQDPSWRPLKIPNRTFLLRRPPTDVLAPDLNDKTEPRPYSILRMPTPTYGNEHRIKFDVDDACPYPVSLYPLFSHLNDRFQPNERWPLGWAPCMLSLQNEPASGSCKDSTGKMIRYECHGNFTKFEEASIIFVDYPFLMHKGEYSQPFYNEEMFPPRRPHQSWWFRFVEESLGYYPWIGVREMIDRFDLTIGQPTSIFDLPDVQFRIPPYEIVSAENPTPRRKRTDVPIAMMISNCSPKNGRDEYLKELAKHVPIHSYGACMQNTKVPPKVYKELGVDADMYLNYKVKKYIFNQYKFVIAFENSNCEDYVTEKIWHAYEAKAIPIYMGAHNVDQYVPHPDSYLNVANFSSPAALASHVLRIAGDYNLEQRYHAWRQPERKVKTMPPERENSVLPEMYRLQNENMICRMLSRAVVV